MIYGNELNKLLKDEKNIVNRMYLNEILLQYRKFVEVLTADQGSDDDYCNALAVAMTSFTSHLESHKYHYNRATKVGFKKSSPVMSSSYIDDFIMSIVNRQKILNNKGVMWGRHSFGMDMKFAPNSFYDMEKDLNFYQKESPNFLLLSQKIEFQFRVAGRKKFSKHDIVLPLLIFVIHKKLHSEDIIRINFFADKAKRTFGNSKMIVICETLDNNFSNDDISSLIDIVYVLRKRKSMKRNGIIHADVIKAMSDRIESYIYESGSSEKDYEETGFILPAD